MGVLTGIRDNPMTGVALGVFTGFVGGLID